MNGVGVGGRGGAKNEPGDEQVICSLACRSRGSQITLHPHAQLACDRATYPMKVDRGSSPRPPLRSLTANRGRLLNIDSDLVAMLPVL